MMKEKETVPNFPATAPSPAPDLFAPVCSWPAYPAAQLAQLFTTQGSHPLKKAEFYEKVSQTADPPPYCFYEILIQKFDHISGTYVFLNKGWLPLGKQLGQPLKQEEENKERLGVCSSV